MASSDPPDSAQTGLFSGENLAQTAEIGAVAIKQSVYVLPDNAQAYEDLHWIVKEIAEGGGTASLARAAFLEGLSDTQVVTLFQVARDREYEKVVRDVQATLDDSAESLDCSEAALLKKRKELARIQRRFTEIEGIDFFHAPGGRDAAEILAECEAVLGGRAEPVFSGAREIPQLSGRTWVTRKNINIDRIASAWLISRFIDPQCCLKFVAEEGYQPCSGELRFDMFAGEFTHRGDNCTFEVLVEVFGLSGRPLTAIAEIVHDMDLKDGKFGRQEKNGIEAVFSGLIVTCSSDEDRLERGSMILDELYVSFGGKPDKRTDRE